MERIACELDYRANPHASWLAAGCSGTIGIVLPILNSWFYGNVLAGAEAVLSQDRLDMHLVTVGTDEEVEHFLSDLPALSNQVDGPIIVDLFMSEPVLDDLRESGLPLATVVWTPVFSIR